jgi:hypothetical protein
VAAAVNCKGAAPDPKETVGFGGSIVIVETVGFWKNPVQLTPRAKATTAANAPARRSLDLVDDIAIDAPRGARTQLDCPVVEHTF